MFSLPQAIAGAEAGAYLISPFVGRIMDWYKAHEKKDGYPSHEDPGVKSVQRIFNYYKKYGYETIVMGASFRNVGEITELAGCDYLTIAVSGVLLPNTISVRASPLYSHNGLPLRSCHQALNLANATPQPNLLEDLYNSKDEVPKKLDASDASNLDIKKASYIDNEPLFRFDFNEDPMAVDKLREGISKFAADAITLKGILREKMEKS